jgi:allantoinase
MASLIIRSERVVLPDGVRPAAIHVRDGRIVEIADYTEPPAGVERLEAGELVVMAGLVDTHVHLNDPGRADWEGFEHGTRAAAAGGITTLVDMPLNSIPSTTSVEGLEAKRRAAAGRLHVDVGFWGGVVPGNAAALAPLASAGVLGFKCFLSPSGVDEFPHVGEPDLREAVPVVARLGLPLLVHAEWPPLLNDPLTGSDGVRRDPRRYATWLESRPPHSEQAAIDLVIELARDSGARVHVVHLAAPDALPRIGAARAAGVKVTVETCPHYLTFAAEDIADGATAFKCAPPIREASRREALWTALFDGTIDLVATDHSPAPPGLKHLDDGDFVQAWGGIASLQISLPAVWTGAVTRGAAVDRVSMWLAEGPARLAGLERRKGRIAAGLDADLVIWDPDEEIVVDAQALHHRHHVTPYAGRRVRGVVHQTLLRGELIFDRQTVSASPRGRALLR